ELEKMTYEVVKDPQTAADLYEAGTVDRATLSSDLVDKYSTHSDYEAIPQASMFYLKMNQTRNEALENTNIRAAISRAFNKEELVDQILNNGSLVANCLVPEEFTTSYPLFNIWSTNSSLLNALLIAARIFVEHLIKKN